MAATQKAADNKIREKQKYITLIKEYKSLNLQPVSHCKIHTVKTDQRYIN